MIVLRTNTKYGTFTTIETYILKVAKFRELVISPLDNHKRVADGLHLVAVENGARKSFMKGSEMLYHKPLITEPPGWPSIWGTNQLIWSFPPKNTKCLLIWNIGSRLSERPLVYPLKKGVIEGSQLPAPSLPLHQV